MSMPLLKTMTHFGRAGQPFLNIGHRPFASRANCAKDNGPRCSPEKMAKIKCVDKRDSQWFNPKCCLEPCSEAMARFDDMYYKPSCKNRKFTRTWVECDKALVKPRKVCCFDNAAMPPIERRLCKRAKSNCSLSPEPNGLMKCSYRKSLKCPKWTMPGCKTVRDPPRCFELRKPMKCKKQCAPSPAFSECNRPKPSKRHPRECGCWDIAPFCHTH